MPTSQAPRAAVLSFARRVAVIGSSALLLALPFTASAGAQSTDGSGTTASTVTQLPADRLPADLVAAITRDLQISPQEYLDRAARAQELGSYAADFRAARPAEFAGAWMDPDGSPIVAVTTTAAARTVSDDGYRPHVTAVSADVLERALADFNRWVTELPRRVASQIGTASIDFLNNRIVVDIANSPIGRAIDLPTHIANIKVQLQTVGPVPVEQLPMGGDGYITPPTRASENTYGYCSFGFSGVDRYGTALNISAGHCDPARGTDVGVHLPNHANLAESLRVGEFVRSEIGGAATTDYSVIRLNDAGVRAGLDRPVVRGAGGSTLTVTGTAVPVTGAPICKSGQTSGFTCGTVSYDRVEASLETDTGAVYIVRGFSGTACTLAGDSGGPIVTGTLALGITSGSNSTYARSCAEASAVHAFNGGTSGFGVPILNILDTANAASGGGIGSGLTVRTGR